MRTLVKVARTVPLALTLMVVLSGPAWAGLCGRFPALPFCPDDTTPAPEIDPNLMRGTIAVLAGGAMMLAGRRRRS